MSKDFSTDKRSEHLVICRSVQEAAYTAIQFFRSKEQLLVPSTPSYNLVAAAILQFCRRHLVKRSKDHIRRLILQFVQNGFQASDEIVSMTRDGYRPSSHYKTRSKKHKPLKKKPPKTEHHKAYLVYITSPEWYAFKATVIQLRGNKCERCDATAKETRIDLHHLTYARLFHELPEDVQLCCRACHMKIHIKKIKRMANRTPTLEIPSSSTLRREAARKYNQV